MTWAAVTADVLKLMGVGLLVLLNAFFVAAELALVRIRDTQLASLAAQGNRRARTVRHIVAHIDAYISATQLGVTLASMGLGVLVEPVFHDLLRPVFALLGINDAEWQRGIAIGIGFFVNCYLLIVVGELVPKAIALRRSLQTSLRVAGPLIWFYRVAFPFIWLLHRSSQFVLKRIGFPVAEFQGMHSEEELRLLLSTTRGVAAGTALGRNIILNSLDLRHRIAREIMRPRHEITGFDTEASLDDCLALAEKTRYSRFPLCEGGDLDKTRGVIHFKDLYAWRGQARTAAELLPLVRPLIYAPETSRLEKLLQLFLERKTHFAVIVDEYGGTTGIVTLENVLETLVGQIQDEFDMETSELSRLGENIWEAAGTLSLHELEKITSRLDHDENVTTASGWLTEKLGGFPKVGDSIQAGACSLRVEEMDGPRVARFKITRSAVSETDAQTI